MLDILIFTVQVVLAFIGAYQLFFCLFGWYRQ